MIKYIYTLPIGRLFKKIRKAFIKVVGFKKKQSTSMIDRLSSERESNVCITHKNVCICMIDIVNFSHGVISKILNISSRQ